MNQADALSLYDSASGKRYPLQGRIITIGSAPDCTIQLALPCPLHAGHCLFTNGTYHFQSLINTPSISINSEKFNGKHKLRKGDRIQIGSLCLVFDDHNELGSSISGTTGPVDELINMILLLLRNRDRDITSNMMTAISRLLNCDAARIVSEDPQTGNRYTLVRFPAHIGLDRFSNRAIDWARDALKTVLMLEPDWVDSSSSNQSLEKNAVASILCAPIRNENQLKGYLYLDRLKKDNSFTESDRDFCDRLLPLFTELLSNSEERKRQTEIIATLQKAQENDSSGIIYRSERMHAALSLADRIAPTDSPVLILGETGTGKELMARYLHSKSLRSGKPFKAVNCGAIPENLIESELFGYEKGAFTGANSRKIGLFESADGGTVFLDELGEMPLLLQVKLLRVLQESEVVRVGGTDPVKVDVRIIAATNRDLKNDTENGKFRSDLYFRLNVLSITIPPLRERSEDILLLAEYLIGKFSARMGRVPKVLSGEARQLLSTHLWPGNVRELENVIQKAVVLSPSNKIGKEDLEISHCQDQLTSDKPERIPTIREARELAEKALIRSALQATMGNVSHTSRILEIDRKWLLTKMGEYGIDAEEYRKPGIRQDSAE